MSEPEISPAFVIPESDDRLLAECRVNTMRAGGKGGQHQNTTDSAVRLTHLPTGIVVVARARRSQLRNREAALGILRRRLENRLMTRPPRIPTHVPPSQKRARRETKRQRAEVKRLRQRPTEDDP